MVVHLLQDRFCFLFVIMTTLHLSRPRWNMRMTRKQFTVEILLDQHLVSGYLTSQFPIRTVEVAYSAQILVITTNLHQITLTPMSRENPCLLGASTLLRQKLKCYVNLKLYILMANNFAKKITVYRKFFNKRLFCFD